MKVKTAIPKATLPPLGQDGGQGRAGDVHSKTGHQQEVAGDIDDAGDEDEEQRRAAVAQPPEYGRQEVIGDDEEYAAAADADIGHRLRKGLLRGLHEDGYRAGEADQHDQKCDRHYREYDGRAAEDGADALGLLFAKVPGEQDGDAHGQLGHDEGDEIEQLAAGRYARQAGDRAEAADDQQIDGAVGRLEHQRAQYRKHEEAELFEYAALREIGLIVIQG